MTIPEPRIAAEKRGRLGLLTLRRPAALNALDRGMVNALAAALTAWAQDPVVTVVAIRGEGPRAFCAGGDIRAWIEGGPDAALDFLKHEYRLNDQIAAYPKPIVALLHGITMGGGAGLSIHARYRVADASLAFAMPEAGIGFLPDVGSTYFLPRCPDRIGLYLALTAGRIGLGDAVAAGLVTHAVAAEAFDPLLEKFASGEAVETAIDGFAKRPGPSALAPHRKRLATLLAAPSVEAVLERLARDGGEFALRTTDAIRANSPTSLKLAFRLLHEGEKLSLRDCLKQEYRAAAHIFRKGDLKEGVRAALIDKDRTPHWQPDSLAAVTDRDIDGYFASLEEDELIFT